MIRGRILNILRVVRVSSNWCEPPRASPADTRLAPLHSCTTRQTWHSVLPGMALIFAGASTVSLCEAESRGTPLSFSAKAQPPVSNEHIKSWTKCTEKAVELSLEGKLEHAEKYMSVALSEAVKGCGTDDPITAGARQNLAEQYILAKKYDLTLPLYNEAVASFTRACGLGDIRTSKALHNLADLHMARKDAQAASQTMQRAIESERLALGPTHPDVAKWVLELAAIYRKSDGSRDAIGLLQKELDSLTKAGQAASPGVVSLASRLAKDQKEAGMLSEAEATCRTLSSTIQDDPGFDKEHDLLDEIIIETARIVRAQGRIDEARQLCEHTYSRLSLGSHGPVYPGYWPALQLLVEIEMEVGTQDSHLCAINHLRIFCACYQAYLDNRLADIATKTQMVWYKPWTWANKVLNAKDAKERVFNLLFVALWQLEAQQNLAQHQSRLERHLDAFATLAQALDVLQDPVLAQSIETADPELWVSEAFAGHEQEVQKQMSASYKAGCSSAAVAHNTRKMCATLQRQLTAALAA